ncbi:MAG: hypothetical protein ACFCU4_03705 [Puniceicoccaceae bacterium]
MRARHQRLSQHLAVQPGQQGFALIITLSLVGLVFISVMAISSASRSGIRSSQSLAQNLEAQLVAKLALHIALGEMQTSLGTDAAATLPSGANPGSPTAHWSRSIGGAKEGWLISGGEAFSSGSGSYESTNDILATNGASTIDVMAAWIPGSVDNQRFAWYVSDEGTKASFAIPDRSGPNQSQGRGLLPENPSDAFVLTQLQARRPRSEIFFPDFDLDAYSIPQVDQVRHPEQFQLFSAASDFKTHFHDLTPLSIGLPTRPEGGLKLNLTSGSSALSQESFFNPQAAAVLGKFLDPGPDWSWPSSAALRREDVDPSISARYPEDWTVLSPGNQTLPPPATIDGMFVDSLLPIITEMKIYGAVFNEGRDGQHRLRYYGGFQLWNPYSFPLRIHSRQYNNGIYYINVTGTQHLEVSLYPPAWDGSSPPLRRFVVSTDPFPNIRNANTNNRREELSYNFQLVLETSQPRPPRAIMQPGQVYHAEWPDARDDATGLSRLLTSQSGEEWWAEWAPGRGSRPADYGANHIVRIRSVDTNGQPVAPKLNIQLKRFVGDSDRNGLLPPDYPGSLVMEYRNVPFAPFDMILSGAEYYLAQSGQYNRADYRFAYHFKIENEDEVPGILGQLSERVDLRHPIIDFDDPEVARLFYVESDAELAVRSGTAFSVIDDGESPFWAQTLNRSGPSGSFRLFDFPNRPPVSLAALRQLPLVGKNPYSIGSEYGEKWNQIFDRYFLTGSTEEGDEFSKVPASPTPRNRSWAKDEPLPPLPNHRLRILDEGLLASGWDRPADPSGMGQLARQPDLAKAVWIEGSFNLNSTSPKAWAALLTQNIPNWESRLAQQGVGSSQALERVFFRHPFNGGAPLPEKQAHLSDPEFALLNGLKQQQQILFGQGFRWLGGDGSDGAKALQRLSESIAAKVRQHHLTSGPFRSISSFLDSGILREAIADSGVNQDITPGSVLYLREGDLLELVAPVLAARSDTFKIYTIGELAAPDGAIVRHRLEATVVRRHEFVDSVANPPEAPSADLSSLNAKLGRAFRILDYRWNPETGTE